MVEDVTVLIANLGGVQQLRPCLHSLFESMDEAISLRVLVGFNYEGESEAPQAIAREFPQVEQLHAAGKLGYCRAYNQMIHWAQGRYLLLLDDDSIVPPGTIGGMVRFMDANPKVGIAGCRTVNPDGTYQKSTGRMYSFATELANMFQPAAFWRDGIDARVTGWRPAGWLQSNFLLVRSEMVAEVGGFDERFYTFQCEADWCLRIRRAGWEVAYVGDFEVTHIGGLHSGSSRVKTLPNLLRSHVNRYYFMRKHYGQAALLAFRLIMATGGAARLLAYAILWLVRPGRRAEAGPKITAYWKLLIMSVAPDPERLPTELQHQRIVVGQFRPVPR